MSADNHGHDARADLPEAAAKSGSGDATQPWEKVASRDAVGALLASDPCVNVYGCAEMEVLPGAVRAFVANDVVAVATGKTPFYPSLLPILQLYRSRSDAPDLSVDIDQLPIEDEQVLVYAAPSVTVASRERAAVGSISLQRYRLSELTDAVPVAVDCTIRPVEFRDREAIAEFYADVGDNRFNSLFLDQQNFVAAWDAGGQCVGAVGTHAISTRASCSLMGHLAVSKHWRGSGLGVALLTVISRRLADLYRHVLCDIDPGNEASVAVHRKVGYRPISETPTITIFSERRKRASFDVASAGSDKDDVDRA